MDPTIPPRDPTEGMRPARDPLEGLRFTFKSDEAPDSSAPEGDDGADDAFGDRPHLHFGETPLTDPRSLGSSTLVHAVLILVGSLTVLNVALPRAADERPTAMTGEVDPVDNRADGKKAGGSGGGS